MNESVETGNTTSQKNCKKRDREEGDKSFEGTYGVFSISKKTPRTPEKSKVKTENKQKMEEKIDTLTEMLSTFMKDIKKEVVKIQTEVAEIRGEVSDIKNGMALNNVELQNLKEEIRFDQENRKLDYKETERKFEEMEIRLEKLEREKIKNNLVISGIKIDTEDKETLKVATKNFIKEALNADVEIKDAYKIGDKRCIVEMENMKDKAEILRNKAKLRGKDVFIDSDLTLKERKIQKQLREMAKIEKGKGAKVKVRYQKLIVDGKLMVWDEKTNILKEKSFERGPVQGPSKNA